MSRREPRRQLAQIVKRNTRGQFTVPYVETLTGRNLFPEKYIPLGGNIGARLRVIPVVGMNLVDQLPKQNANRKTSDMKPHHSFLLFGVAFMGLASTATAAGDATRGQTLYQTICVACHSIEYNGVGPAHKGLYGRKAGEQAEYVYSPALKSSSVVWTDVTLDKWLTNPEKLIPGQKMGVTVPSAEDRLDLIAYLKKETAQK